MEPVRDPRPGLGTFFLTSRLSDGTMTFLSGYLQCADQPLPPVTGILGRLHGGAGGCHLDLHVDPAAESLHAVADRAVAAGALIRHREDGLVVAVSPGGFAFCLVHWAGERAVPAPVAAVSGGGASRADTLCLDVPPGDFARELAFWAALTGQQARPAPVPGFASLRRPDGWPARLLLQRRDSASPGDRTRGHVDFGCTDAAALDRHVALGARVTGTQEYWTVLTDPVGREYCLVGRSPG